MPEIDIEVGKKLIKCRKNIINEELKKKDLENFNDWKKLKEIASNQGQPFTIQFKSIYNANYFKSTYEETAKSILLKIREHVNNQVNFQQPYDKFCITLSELSKIRGLSKMTISRHLNYLEKHNIIFRKFRGTTHPQEIRMNPDFLPVRINPLTGLYIVEKYGFLGEKAVNDMLMGKAYCLPFGNYFHWPIITSCGYNNNHLNYLVYIKQDGSGVLFQNGFNEVLLEHGKPSYQTPPPTPSPSFDNEKSPQTLPEKTDRPYLEEERIRNVKNTFESYRRILLNTCLKVLYPGYVLYENEKLEVERHLGNMLKNRDGSYMDVPNMGIKFREITTRFFKVYAWKFRQPNRYLPRPSVYLNPELPNGFKNTEVWFIEDMKKQKENPNWNNNVRLLLAQVEKYHKDPTFNNYMDGLRELQQKGNNKLIELYSQAVIGENDLKSVNFKALLNDGNKNSVK